MTWSPELEGDIYNPKSSSALNSDHTRNSRQNELKWLPRLKELRCSKITQDLISFFYTTAVKHHTITANTDNKYLVTAI